MNFVKVLIPSAEGGDKYPWIVGASPHEVLVVKGLG